MGKTGNFKKVLAFILSVAVICSVFAVAAIWKKPRIMEVNAAGDDAIITLQDDTIITLQIGNPTMFIGEQATEIDPGRGTVPILTEEGRTLLPVRSIIEAVGGSVAWDEETQTATLTYGGDVIRLIINSKTAYLNDEPQTLDVSPVAMNDRTMLPIRFIAESFHFDVGWDEDTQTVTITVPAKNAEPSMTGQNKTLVVYYSATDNTHRVANIIANEAGADVFRIEPAEPYTSEDLNWNNENSRVSREHDNPNDRNVALAQTTVPNWNSYDTVFIGYPIWWGIAAWPTSSFVAENDFTGKTVIPFCTSLSSGIGDSGKLLEEAAKTGNWLDGMRFSSGADEKEIRTWVNSLSLSATSTGETTENGSVVYMTTDITPEALVKIYEQLGFNAEGNVAVKMSTGEPPASNYLRPELIGDLVKEVDGTIVECNTAYGGSRASTAAHKQVIEDHGLNAISKNGVADIMDEDGSLVIPVPTPENGKSTITEDYVGAHLANYDSLISLAHFKGHAMAGFGGAIKNMSIGISSSEGKSYIHSAGQSRTSPWGGDQDKFLESMGDATSAVVDYMDNKVVYINVMNRLSVDCDCDGNPAEPDMHDIGILASYDPVALDQACIDLIYAQKDGDGASLVQRIESRNGLHTLEHAEEIGLGSRTYNLVSID